MDDRNDGVIVPTLNNATPIALLGMGGVEFKKKMDQQPNLWEMENEAIPSILQSDVSEDVAAEISMWEFYDQLTSRE